MSSSGAMVVEFVDLGFACVDLAREHALQWKLVEGDGRFLPST